MTSPDLLEPSRVDAAIHQLGAALWTRMQGKRPDLFHAQLWQGRMLEWVMRDPSFKVDLFRFVDVLPRLKNTQQVMQHIREYLLKDGRDLPGLGTTAHKASAHNLAAGLGARALKKNVYDMAERFIAGHGADDTMSILRRLHHDGIAFSVDVLGETTNSHAAADAYGACYVDLIDRLARMTAAWRPDPVIDANHLGPIPRANVSLKISALEPHLDAVDAAGSVSRLKARVLPLFLQARAHQVFLNVDLEQWALHGMTYDLFEDIVTDPRLRNWPHVGIVLQTYLHSARQDIERLLQIARQRGTPFTVRLVKGAYWDYEVAHARQHGYPCPVFTDKASTDAAYEELSRFLLDHIDDLHPAFGSHNLRSLAHAMAQAQSRKVPPNAYELQMRYGMAEPERQAMRAMGHRVRVYAPVGDLLQGMAYLVCRLLENTSTNSFLRLSHHDNVDLTTLLARPQPQPFTVSAIDTTPGDLTTPFSNCPQLDFTDDKVRHSFAHAIEDVAASFPIEVPVMVNGKTRQTQPQLERVCPSEPQRQVAAVTLANETDAETAVTAAAQAWPSWRERAVAERAQLLDNLANRLQADRMRLAALQTFEVGKPWREADADVAEGIDFCRYYARQALTELTPRQLNTMAGERNELFYEGRGVAAVIAPWNVPLARLCGMTTASLVAGNTVVIKPAEQASATAWRFYQHLLAAGFPPHVVQFLPGIGAEVGRYLVAHPQVAQIAFSGSTAVGLALIEQAGKTQPGQPQIKRVVCDMGGQNAIVIDDDADLDEAVAGVVHSAFGYAGQHSSACSRVIVVGHVYDAFVARFIDACRSLTMAPAHLPACRLGPVIDAAAQRRLQDVIANPGAGASPLYIGSAPNHGWYVAPAVFAVQDATHRLMQEAWLGPIVAVMQVASFDDALQVANSTEFALTGAVYSRSPHHLEQARQCIRVGNLYLNQGCTGALVQRQPFGGFDMSGTGIKAGSPGYLQHFADPRCVTENTMRRGFTPELS